MRRAGVAGDEADPTAVTVALREVRDAARRGTGLPAAIVRAQAAGGRAPAIHRAMREGWGPRRPSPVP